MEDCDICCNLKPLGYILVGWGLFRTVQALRESAFGGSCGDCRMLYDGLCQFNLALSSGVEDVSLGESSKGLEIESTEAVEFKTPRVGDPSSAVEFYLQHGPLAQNQRIRSCRNIPGNTASQESVSWAQGCLDMCLKKHKFCKASGNTPLPTRVLDLGSGGDADNPDSVRLYVTKNESAQYACLSHCWGRAASLQTVQSNIEEHQKCISWPLLPKTFQDAIKFARKIHIRYLWIDSLCIVQDSPEDWEMESNRMHSVFRNAALTIAATRSGDSSGGLFTEAATEFHGMKIGELEVDFDDGKQSKHEIVEVWVRQALLQTHDRFNDSSYVTKGLPLLDRGWVLQERLLSPRVLHFGPQVLIWECSENSLCECHSIDNSVSDMKSKHIKVLQNVPDSPFGFLPSHDPRRNIALWWEELINEYSKLNLSFPSDRLPALAGLAKQFLSSQADEYVAGMWEGSLFRDLIWHVRPQNRASKLKQWRAPSWSWVSVDGAVYYRTNPTPDDPKRLCKVLDYQCITTNSEPTSRLTSATMRIHGTIASVVLHHRVPDEETTYTNFYLTSTNGAEAVDFFADYSLHELGTGYIAPGASLHCLKLCSDDHHQHSLVLRCVDAAAQMYERVGIVQEWDREFVKADGSSYGLFLCEGLGEEMEITLI